MWNGCVFSVHTTTAEAQPMLDIQEAHAIPGKGLEGNRYFLGTGYFSRHHSPSHEVTLIELETIEALNEENEGTRIYPRDARRNIVTRGVPLNHLVAHICLHIAKITHHSLLSGLIHRGGLRAQILTEGIAELEGPIAVANNPLFQKMAKHP